jgi:hypothetical protein
MRDQNGMLEQNVIDLRSYQQARRIVGKAQAMTARLCRHCGAALLDGESDDDCSSADLTGTAPRLRMIYAD